MEEPSTLIAHLQILPLQYPNVFIKDPTYQIYRSLTHFVRFA